jgi:hypothetical protein
VSGSERVYVNGTLLNVAKIMIIRSITMQVKLYTPLFTITSEMRIAIEYQFSDRNYTVLSGEQHVKKWSFGGYLYSENDVKNNPCNKIYHRTSTY